MNDEDLKCSQIHGCDSEFVRDSDDSDVSNSKEFDETYRLFKPPPIQIDENAVILIKPNDNTTMDDSISTKNSIEPDELNQDDHTTSHNDKNELQQSNQADITTNILSMPRKKKPRRRNKKKLKKEHAGISYTSSHTVEVPIPDILQDESSSVEVSNLSGNLSEVLVETTTLIPENGTPSEKCNNQHTNSSTELSPAIPEFVENVSSSIVTNPELLPIEMSFNAYNPESMTLMNYLNDIPKSDKNFPGEFMVQTIIPLPLIDPQNEKEQGKQIVVKRVFEKLTTSKYKRLMSFYLQNRKNTTDVNNKMPISSPVIHAEHNQPTKTLCSKHLANKIDPSVNNQNSKIIEVTDLSKEVTADLSSTEDVDNCNLSINHPDMDSSNICVEPINLIHYSTSSNNCNFSSDEDYPQNVNKSIKNVSGHNDGFFIKFIYFISRYFQLIFNGDIIFCVANFLLWCSLKLLLPSITWIITYYVNSFIDNAIMIMIFAIIVHFVKNSFVVFKCSRGWVHMS